MTAAELIPFVRKNPISFGCGVLALALGAAIYLRSSSVPEAVTLLDQKSAEGGRLAANARNSAQLTEQFAAITGATKSINSRLIHASDLAQNLQYFYKLEAETGTKLLDLRQGPLPAKGKPAAGSPVGVPFFVSVRGDYFALLEFLRHLESGPHFCRVMSLAISTTGPDRAAPITFQLGVELLGLP